MHFERFSCPLCHFLPSFFRSSFCRLWLQLDNCSASLGVSWRTLNPATSWPVEGQSNWRAKILAHESNWAYQFSNTKSYHCLEACILFFRKSRMISQWCLSVLNCFFKDYFFSLTKCTCLNKSNTVFLGWDKVIYKGDFIFHFHYFI